MFIERSLDSQVRTRLKTWPQHPPGVAPRSFGRDIWLRGRPSDFNEAAQPFLKLPGSNRLRTLPDGLWLNFGGTPAEPFVDILAVEACSSLANLLDKRSRFAPSTQSLMAVCPVSWLLTPVVIDDPMPRWRMTGVVRREPTTPLILPVRDMRVLYGLKPRHYQGFAASLVPHPHEYFVPMQSLITENGHHDPALRALLSRASTTANFLNPAEAGAAQQTLSPPTQPWQDQAGP